MSIRASIFPSKVRVIQDSDDNDEYPHVLRLEDEDGGDFSAYLSPEVFSALWKAMEQPEVEREDEAQPVG